MLCPDISPLFLSLISELRGYLLPLPLVALALLSSLSLGLLPWEFLFRCFIFPTSAYLRKLFLFSGRSHPTLSRLLTLKWSSRALPLTLLTSPFLSTLLSLLCSQQLSLSASSLRFVNILSDRRATTPVGPVAYSLGP